tara:strand:+ start:1998 stop:2297 length:300 start_codon:yes stop_codon:yes gene_type:complete
MIKRFIAYFKEELRKKNGKIHNYHNFKNTYVEYGGNRSKVKLRSHLSKLASNINDLNYKGYLLNRANLIDEFEYGGLKAVGVFADKEISKFIDKSKEKR